MRYNLSTELHFKKVVQFRFVHAVFYKKIGGCLII